MRCDVDFMLIVKSLIRQDLVSGVVPLLLNGLFHCFTGISVWKCFGLSVFVCIYKICLRGGHKTGSVCLSLCTNKQRWL